MDQSAYQPPTMADVPVQTEIKQIPRKGLEISLHAADEVTVPLDATCIDDCMWLRWDREKHKALLLSKWRDQLGDLQNGDNDNDDDDDTAAQQYAEQIRSAMGSPIGLVRSSRANQWTQSDTWLRPEMYEMLKDASLRQVLKENFPGGLRYTSVRGKIVDMVEEFLPDVWQEVKPEPAKRIMADPLGDDWTETQDIHTNTLNQCNEIVERSNQSGFFDPTRVDGDALQNRRSLPGEMTPALRPPGGSLSDIVYQPESLVFSEQIPVFRQQVVSTAQNVSGLEDSVYGGGDAEEPTARQAELKKNAALQQLGVTWAMMGNALEKLTKKCCKILAKYEDGVLAFSKKNQFGQFDTMSIVVGDLATGKYHFEADEAIPMTWGQQRDLLMWMLDKPAPLLQQWGMDDPLNIFEFKQLLGMPGERTPGLDQRVKCMNVIAKLLTEPPVPGPTDSQTQQPGPLQSSIQPDWEDDHDFCARLFKAYLVVNSHLAEDNPPGYQNVQLLGQAHFNMANAPAAPAAPKTSVALSLKGEDLGSPAVQAVLSKEGILPNGTQVESNTDKQLALQQPPPGAAMPPPNAIPTIQPGQATQSPIQ